MTGGRVVYAYARIVQVLVHRLSPVVEKACAPRAAPIELAAELGIVWITPALAKSVALLRGQAGVLRNLDHLGWAGGALNATLILLQHVAHGR